MNIRLKSNFQEKNGEFLDENIEVTVKTDNDVIIASIKNIDTNTYLLENTPMEIIQEDYSKTTIEGLKPNNSKNKWNKDFSNVGIRFMRDAMGRFGVTILWLKDKNETISIIPSK